MPRMRLRSVATVLAMAGLLAGALVRCSLPPVPPGPTALPTRVGFAHGAIIAVPKGTIDRAKLVASLKTFDVTTIILEASADETGVFVDDRVSLAIDLQRELNAVVLIGTYQSASRQRKSMEELLLPDPSFTTCYTHGPRLDPNAALIDKLKVCSQDVSRQIAGALKAQNASDKIGCSIAQQTELVDTLTNEGKTKLASFFHDSASACAEAKRIVATSPLLSASSEDPERAALTLREALRGSGVGLVTLRDGVGSVDPSKPNRARPYYQGLRNAITDREPLVFIFAGVEAFDCDTPACAKKHPTTRKRYLDQLCGARTLVDGIMTIEYLDDLAGPLFTSPLDGSAEVQAIANDSDASAQLRNAYLDWRDAGGPCPAPADAGAPAKD